MRLTYFLAICFCLPALAGTGQEVFSHRPSPLDITSARYKDGYIKIVYSQPQKKGRTVFGALVPYGQVWRTGANEASEITATKDIIVNGQLLKAGTYSIFTIPNADRWTIILNKDVGLWGAYNYNEKNDVLRFDVPVQENTVNYEAFTMKLEQRNELADLLMMWDNVKLTIPVKFIE